LFVDAHVQLSRAVARVCYHELTYL
jgi:hypothetical protein